MKMFRGIIQYVHHLEHGTNSVIIISKLLEESDEIELPQKDGVVRLKGGIRW